MILVPKKISEPEFPIRGVSGMAPLKRSVRHHSPVFLFLKIA